MFLDCSGPSVIRGKVSELVIQSMILVSSDSTEKLLKNINLFSGGAVTARGCSTKDKIFHIECENHVMGRTSEKFCYCSYFLCNGGSSDGLGFVIWVNLFLAVIVNRVFSK